MRKSRKEKKRKRPRKARRWLQQRQRSVCPKPRIPFFWFTSIWGSEVTRLGYSISSYETWSMRKPCAKAVPEMDSLTQQKQYHKRTTLRSKKLPLQSIRSKEGLHYCVSKAQESCHLTSDKCHMWHGCVEDPAAKHSWRGRPALSPWSEARGSCQKTSGNQPYSRVWISFGDSIPGLYCVAWLTQERVSLRIFVRKKGMNHVQSNGRSQQTPSAKGGKVRIYQ